MPYIAEESKILTKLINVTYTDRSGNGRQQALLDMRNNPDDVKRIYISGMRVYVTFESDNTVCIGSIQNKYKHLIESNETTLFSWLITGGDEKIDGYGYQGREMMKYLGINIQILLNKPR